MIINEKQVMQLIMIARSYIEELNKSGIMGQVTASKLSEFLHEITIQQSEELKVVE